MAFDFRKNIQQFGLLFLVSLAVALGPGAHLLSFAWRTDDQSYILLVPVISAGLIYRDRERIFSHRAPGFSVSAAIAFAVGLAFMAVAYVSAAGSELQLAATALGLLACWVGAFIFAFGRDSARAALFPLGMLLWMVPIPAICINAVVVSLQRGSAELVDLMFRATGVPVFRDGFIFQLPGQAIEVAKECSGIRSSLSMILLTLVIAHESLASNWRRGVLMLFVMPIVIVKNAVRIVALTLLAIYVDPSFLSGRLHHEGGIVFFLIGLVMLAPILMLLRRGEAPAKSAPPPVAQTAAAAHD